MRAQTKKLDFCHFTLNENSLSVKTSKVHQSKSVTNLIILNTNWNKIIFANIDGTLNFNKFLKWHWFYVHLSKFSTSNFEFRANIPVRDSKRKISTKRVEGGHETEEFPLKFSRKKQNLLFGGIRKNWRSASTWISHLRRKTFLVTDLNYISILFNEYSLVNMFSSIDIHYKLYPKVSFQLFLCKFIFRIPRIGAFFGDFKFL